MSQLDMQMAALALGGFMFGIGTWFGYSLKSYFPRRKSDQEVAEIAMILREERERVRRQRGSR